MRLLKIAKYVLSVSMLLSFSAQGKLTVHEWGTFTSLVGSDGRPQDGMIYEDENLPDFVHHFGRPKTGIHGFEFLPFARDPFPRPAPTPNPDPPRRGCGHFKVPCAFLENEVITQKMETPVVYFYADQTQNVRFDVWFPDGIVSQSFPKASRSFPLAIPGVELKRGFASYDLKVLKNSSQNPPFVEKSNIYSHARNVASDLIQIGSEIEKFIFYRGLGEFNTEIQVTSQSGALTVANRGQEEIPAIFLISTDGKGRGGIRALGSLPPAAKKSISTADVNSVRDSFKEGGRFLGLARRHLIKSLMASGLYEEEAKSMVNTWEHGYFETPGLRILYVLSRSEVERILPAKVTPQPTTFERVFVGRIEVLLDTEEQKILTQILNEKESYDVRVLGRMAEPTLSRVQEKAQEQGLLTAELRDVFTALKNKALN